MYLSTDPPSDDIVELAKEELADAWDETPTAVLIDKVQRGEFSWLDLLEMDSPTSIIEDTANTFVQHFVDRLASKIPFDASRAAAMGHYHFGLPHVHLLPFPPHPMGPTLGPIALGCCASVVINDSPAARVGDLGLASCLCVAPFFKIMTGSSSVFIGGKRAARQKDMSMHGVTGEPPNPAVAVFNAARKTLAGFLRGRREVKDAEEEANQAMEEASRAMDESLELAAGAPGYLSSATTPIARATRRGRLAVRVTEAAKTSPDLGAAAADATTDAASAAANAAGVAVQAGVAAKQAALDVLASAAEVALALDPTLPPSVGGLLDGSENVLIGGFPTPDIPVPLGHFAKLAPERLRAPLRRADAKVRLKLKVAGIRVHARIDERLPRVSRALTGDPVDVVTGAVLSEGVDAVLRGRGDLVVRRFYSSAWADRPSPLGRGWSLSLDQAVWVEGSFLVYRTDDGRELTYALPEGRGAADERLDGLILVDPANSLRLVALTGGRWRITGPEGAIVELQPIAGERRREAHLARAVALRGPGEVRIDLHHDAEGRLVAARGPGGRTLGLRWDAQDRLEALTLPDPEGPGELEQIRYVRSPADDLVAVVDAAGGRWSYAYDDHRLVEATGPDGRSFHFAYDGRGPEARATRTWGDGGVFERRLCYDTQRRRTVIADGVGGATIVEYDGRGLVSAITDPDGTTRRLLHDAEGRRVAEIDPLGGVVRRRYDDLGRCVEVIAADESTWSFDHDEEGRVILAIDPLGGRWRWRYDDQGRLIARVEANGASFERREDDEGRARISDGEGRHLGLSWSAEGDLCEVEDGEGRRWRFVHDRRGRVREVIEPEGRRRRFIHDRADRAIEASTDDTLAWRVTRDDAGRAIQIMQRGEEPLDLAYGPCGGLARVQGRGRVLEYRRDLEGRLLEIVEGGGVTDDGEGPQERVVHAFTRVIGGALLVERALDGRRLRYRRDPAGRVSVRVEASGEETRFERDPAGRIVAIAYADGARERFAYRGDGALILARRDEGDVACCVELTRDPSGHLSGEIVGDRWVAIDRDRGGRRRRVRSSEGLVVDLIRSARGTLCELEIAAQGGRWRVPVARRAEGAATEVVEACRPAQADVAPAPAPAAQLELDEDGRVIARRLADGSEQRVRWDASHRLRALECDGRETVTFDYDALGRRIRKTSGERTTSWVWDGDLPLHEEVSVAGEVVSRRTWLFDHESFAPIAALIDGRFLEIRCDRIGAPRVALDEAGRAVWRATSAAASVDHRGEGEPGLELPFGLPGHYRDPETGLIYSRHRYLDPASARFLSPDPSGLAGGLDPHAYVDDPTTMIDPLGLRGQGVAPETLPGVPSEPISPLGRASEGPIPPAPTSAPAPGAPALPRAPRPSLEHLLDPLHRGAEILRRRAIEASLKASCPA